MDRTLKQAADELKITKNKLKYHAKNLSADQLKMIDGKWYLTETGYETIKNHINHTEPIQESAETSEEPHETDSEPIEEPHKESVENQLIQMLQAELEEKNRQIQSLQELLRREQELRARSLPMYEDQDETITEPKAKKWWQFWK